MANSDCKELPIYTAVDTEQHYSFVVVFVAT